MSEELIRKRVIEAYGKDDILAMMMNMRRKSINDRTDYEDFSLFEKAFGRTHGRLQYI
ncbi:MULTISPECIES: hypothetical protein [Shewanella]|uniref:hypothetical protein n=1 Tax=Shewanella TaxID=22 RepID=UPI0013E40276|nr:hypothetical protein [Shewanella psychromarinicola]MCL1084326.1 hypothetical protein [Shewanella psychromarinicola]